jgi:hypothetical protein
MKTIQPRSLIIGLALGLGAILVLGDASPVTNQIGRFQILAPTTTTVVVFDTTTGSVKKIDLEKMNYSLNP